MVYPPPPSREQQVGAARLNQLVLLPWRKGTMNRQMRQPLVEWPFRRFCGTQSRQSPWLCRCKPALRSCVVDFVVVYVCDPWHLCAFDVVDDVLSALSPACPAAFQLFLSPSRIVHITASQLAWTAWFKHRFRRGVAEHQSVRR